MKKGGLGRALYYFTRQAQVYVAGIILGSFLLAVYYWFVGGNSVMGFEDIIEQTPAMLVWITLLVLMSSSMGTTQRWVSMLISFGCCRRYAFLGTLAMNLQIMVESLILFAVLMHYCDWDGRTFLLVLVIVLYLVSEGGAQLLGIASSKWGKIAYIFAVMLCSIFIVGVALTNVVVTTRSLNSWWRMIQETVNPVWQCLAIATAGMFFIATNVVGYRLLSKYEVKN